MKKARNKNGDRLYGYWGKARSTGAGDTYGTILAAGDNIPYSTGSTTISIPVIDEETQKPTGEYVTEMIHTSYIDLTNTSKQYFQYIVATNGGIRMSNGNEHFYIMAYSSSATKSQIYVQGLLPDGNTSGKTLPEYIQAWAETVAAEAVFG